MDEAQLADLKRRVEGLFAEVRAWTRGEPTTGMAVFANGRIKPEFEPVVPFPGAELAMSDIVAAVAMYFRDAHALRLIWRCNPTFETYTEDGFTRSMLRIRIGAEPL